MAQLAPRDLNEAHVVTEFLARTNRKSSCRSTCYCSYTDAAAERGRSTASGANGRAHCCGNSTGAARTVLTGTDASLDEIAKNRAIQGTRSKGPGRIASLSEVELHVALLRRIGLCPGHAAHCRSGSSSSN